MGERTPVQMTAAVPQLETVEMPAPPPVPMRPQLVTEPPKRPVAPQQPSFQANLFGPVDTSKQSTGAQQPLARRNSSSPRVRRDFSRQQTLEFPEARTLHNSVEASVYCGAQVAVPTHRVMAALIDSGFAVLGVALFVAVFRLAGMEIVLTKQTIPVYVGAMALITLFYRALFCVANADTPGLRWTGLQILDFDGRKPTRQQRWLRMLGGCVGAISAGIGLLWAVCDEERLTWHDHMSKTFPTPRFL